MHFGNSLRFLALVFFVQVSRGLVGADPEKLDEQAAAKDHPHPSITQLVADLGSEEFAKREQATEQLIRIGLPASAALNAGLTHADREIRYRSQRILIIVREVDFQRRLTAFLTDADRDTDHHLPGWSEFRKRVGDSTVTRELFVEMQKAEPELLMAIQKGAREAASAVHFRSQQLQLGMRNPVVSQPLSLGSIAAMLFVAGSEDVTIDQTASNLLYSFCYQPPFSQAITHQSQSSVLKKMLSAWIRKSDGFLAYQGLHLAMQYDLREGLIPAERVLKNFAANAPHVKMNAILAIAKFGDERHMELIEPLLADKMPYGGTQTVNGEKYTTQIRDIALATLWCLVKENPKDHGFAHVQTHQQVVFNPSSLGFPSDAQRDEARKLWDKFREKK